MKNIDDKDKAFDSEYYELIYPQYVETAKIPILHYIQTGCRAGFNPSPYFNTLFYAGAYPESIQPGTSPVEHYFSKGLNQGIATFPNLSGTLPEPAQKQLEDIAHYLAYKGGIFDPIWYRECNSDLGESICALPHFREFGWREKRAPSPLFDLGTANSVLPPEAENPLIFLCRAQPDYPRFIFGLVDGSLEREAIKADLFDPEYYLDIYREVKESGADPFLHYMLWGWRTGHNPSPYFNTGHYLANYCEASENPLWSRMRTSSDYPTFPVISAIADCDTDIQCHIGEMTAWAAKKHGLFDEEWYLDAYPDIQECGISAFEHFRQNGFKEGRNPSLAFDSAWYAREFLDGDEGICALHHYFFVNKWDEAALLKKVQELGEENEALIAEQDIMRRQITKLESNSSATPGEIEALKKQIGSLQKRCSANDERYRHILEFFKDGIGLIFNNTK